MLYAVIEQKNKINIWILLRNKHPSVHDFLIPASVSFHVFNTFISDNLASNKTNVNY